MNKVVMFIVIIHVDTNALTSPNVKHPWLFIITNRRQHKRQMRRNTK